MNVAVTPNGAKTRPDPQYTSSEPVLFAANQLIQPRSENGAKISIAGVENGGNYEWAEEEFDNDIHICGRCRIEFNDYGLFVQHKKHCSARRLKQPKTSVNSSATQPLTYEDQLASNIPSTSIGNHNTSLSTNTEEAKSIEVNTCDGFLNTNRNECQMDLHSPVVSVYSDSGSIQAIPTSDVAKRTDSTEFESNSNAEHFEKEKTKLKKCSFEGCNYEAKFNKDIARHYTIHSGAKPFTCETCSKGFSRKDKLQRHMKIHTGEKRFECMYCPYKTYEKSHHIKHLRVHTNERPYACQVCNYKAKSSSQLTVHMRKHSGISPFVCCETNCKSVFRTKSDLTRHQRIHSEEKPFSCEVCNHRVYFKANLKAHMKTHSA
eukprot:TRINITY_DN6550_c0_g1_i7.p1 TRINITY_DN6550_c0_g1~~TRINITY_DN6550_c0_g1_i7.p1  ORF type:complete len:376 (+),score=11.07 TRINITY_DN6550_c0_g1_i7:48-1175(+)